MNKNEGKIRSAKVKPFHQGCQIHHGPQGYKLSTISIPMTVNPLSISSDTNLCFFWGSGCSITYEGISQVSFSVRATSDLSVSKLYLSLFICYFRIFIKIQEKMIHQHDEYQINILIYIEILITSIILLLMQTSQQTSPYLQKGFDSAKSQTLNPESTLKKFDYDQDFKILALTASRAKKRIRQTSTTKYRLSLSRNSETLKNQFSLRTSTKISFQPRETISTMVRDRHKIEQDTKKRSNFCNYLSARLKQRSKRKQIIKQKQIKIKQTIEISKQQKQFAEAAIKQHSQTVYVKKLNSKSQVLQHRKSLKNMIDLTMRQKKIMGEIGRRQMLVNHSHIQHIKNNWLQHNKQAVERGKSLEQIYNHHKLMRQNEKKHIAGENYKKKWMQQFMQKERIQRENRLKSRKLNRKIQYLMQQNRKLEASSIL